MCVSSSFDVHILTCHQNSAQILVLATQVPVDAVRYISIGSSFEYHGAKLYNELPESIWTIKGIRVFHAALNKLP